MKTAHRFDPTFDDTAWTDAWAHVPLALVPPGRHPSGYRVERAVWQAAEIFGRRYRLAAPFEGRLLFAPNGTLWMSNTPQEHMMMYNNARRTRGRVLVGGLGLGVYPQYARFVGGATHITVVERSAVVREIVAPTLEAVLDVPLAIHVGDVEAFLRAPPRQRYDTIFLDTWDTLDAANLPAINRLRDLALRHLTPEGTVLLWGYRWMVRLFEEACRQLLRVPPAQRPAWLAAQRHTAPRAVPLLAPVVAHFAQRPAASLDEALAWCRAYIVTRSATPEA